jgi:uncharacterized protein with WD repeat
MPGDKPGKPPSARLDLLGQQAGQFPGSPGFKIVRVVDTKQNFHEITFSAARSRFGFYSGAQTPAYSHPGSFSSRMFRAKNQLMMASQKFTNCVVAAIALVTAAYLSTPHSSTIARLAFGAFCLAIHFFAFLRKHQLMTP